MTFYRSEFYRSGILYRYAQVVNYEHSLEYKVKEEIGKILEFIDDIARITKYALDCILGLKFIHFLKIQSLPSVRDAVFEFVIKNCPNYYKAFKLVRYQEKAPTSFGENKGDSLRL